MYRPDHPRKPQQQPPFPLPTAQQPPDQSSHGETLFTYPFSSFQVDYRSFLDKMWEAMPADEFLAMISDTSVLGNPLLRTQHFVGASRWEKVSDTEVIGHHQLRVPHQVYTDATLAQVRIKGHAHSYNKHWYRKVDGVWKFAGLAPDIRWGEYEFDKIFEGGRENFGEEAKEVQKAVAV